MAFLLLSVRFRIRGGHFIRMSLTSKTIIPSFLERIIKPLAWGFKCLTISSWCVSFSTTAETANCQGKTLRSDPIFLYFFILLSPNISHLPCSSQHSCFCYLGNKGKLIKEILAHQQLGNRQYLYSTYKRVKHSPKRLKHVSTDFSTIQTCLPLRNMTKESRIVKLLLYSWSWSERGPTKYRGSNVPQPGTGGIQQSRSPGHISLRHVWRHIFIITGLKLKKNPNKTTWVA